MIKGLAFGPAKVSVHDAGFDEVGVSTLPAGQRSHVRIVPGAFRCACRTCGLPAGLRETGRGPHGTNLTCRRGVARTPLAPRFRCRPGSRCSRLTSRDASRDSRHKNTRG